jgi:hypothetical protein
MPQYSNLYNEQEIEFNNWRTYIWDKHMIPLQQKYRIKEQFW